LPEEQGGYTVGVLVNANMDTRSNLLVNGVPIGREITDRLPTRGQDGSIIIVIATDAPLDHLKLKRLASKASIGLARTGARSHHGSGDIFIAFSTGNRVPHYPKERTYAMRVVADAHLDPIFEAAQEATEEAILNALTMATTTVGRDGNTAHAIPLDRLVTIMKKYGRLE
jgi:D-aminopeptidase